MPEWYERDRVKVIQEYGLEPPVYIPIQSMTMVDHIWPRVPKVKESSNADT